MHTNIPPPLHHTDTIISMLNIFFSITEILPVERRSKNGKKIKPAKCILSEAHVSGVTTWILFINFLLSLGIFSTNQIPQTMRLLRRFKVNYEEFNKKYYLLSLKWNTYSKTSQLLFSSILMFQDIISSLKFHNPFFDITDLSFHEKSNRKLLTVKLGTFQTMTSLIPVTYKLQAIFKRGQKYRLQEKCSGK